MDSLEQDYVKKRKIYREIFKKSHESLLKQFFDLKKFYLCNKCIQNCSLLANDLFETYPQNCTYRNWQIACLKKLEGQISKDVLVKIKEVLNRRNAFSCNKCAVCCNFACSEFSYDELKEKAKNGDNFASQFISVFVPYGNKEEATKIYPDYVELLKAKYENIDDVHFYHCPKLSEANLCTDYENRPDICRDFPDNPLAILPKSCGYFQWKDEVEITALTLNALSEIIGFYIEKFEKIVKK